MLSIHQLNEGIEEFLVPDLKVGDTVYVTGMTIHRSRYVEILKVTKNYFDFDVCGDFTVRVKKGEYFPLSFHKKTDKKWGGDVYLNKEQRQKWSSFQRKQNDLLFQLIEAGLIDKDGNILKEEQENEEGT